MPTYRLPLITVEQYRRLPADEQYLLISSIHSLYVKMLEQGGTPPSAVAPAAPVPVSPQPQNAQPAPRAPANSRVRRNQNGGIRAAIIRALSGGGSYSTDELYTRVTQDAPYSTHGVRALTHRLVKQGVIERVGRARYRLKQ